VLGNLAKRLAKATATSTFQVHSKVAIAEAKPGRTAKLAQGLQSLKGLLSPPPSGGGIGHTGQCIAHRIQVRANIEAEVLEIIPGIDDYRQAFRRDNPSQTVRQFGAAYTAGEGDDIQWDQGIIQSGTQIKRQSGDQSIRHHVES
jgi:hypothetical protein